MYELWLYDPVSEEPAKVLLFKSASEASYMERTYPTIHPGWRVETFDVTPQYRKGRVV